MKLSERFWNKRKGFTIVELVIVIAIIAILAAVLIPTFSNVIQRSKISADTQLCRNLNTVLTMATSEGRIPQSMYDVLYLISESGYLLANLNPTAEGYYYAWDSEGQKMVYIKEDLQTVVYPEDYKIDVSKCWITVGDQAEAERVAAAGYNIYLENYIETIELHNNAVSIDTGAYKLGSLVIDGSVQDQKDVILSGNFGTTTLDCSNVNYSNVGNISTLNIGAGVSSFAINGNISTFAAASGFKGTASMSSTGAVGKINSGSVTAGTTTFTSADNGKSMTGSVGNNGVVAVASKEAIENIRAQIANGRNFAGETIELSGDVNMSGIAFQPISNYDRDHRTSEDVKGWFQGDFDGKGHTIKGFSTSGFAISGLNAGKNKSSVSVNGVTYNEAVYGLFGAFYVPEGKTATIKNLKIETAIDMTFDDANKYVGDSVGGLIGFAYGAGTLNIEDVTISGTVKGYDGVSAFIGRSYGEGASEKLTINFKNCTNNAAVTGVRKTGAFIGSGIQSSNNFTVTFSNCVNNGNITCLGLQTDLELGVSTAKADNGYYRAGAGTLADGPEKDSQVATVKATLPEGITNNGEVKVNDIKVVYN